MTIRSRTTRTWTRKIRVLRSRNTCTVVEQEGNEKCILACLIQIFVLLFPNLIIREVGNFREIMSCFGETVVNDIFQTKPFI